MSSLELSSVSMSSSMRPLKNDGGGVCAIGDAIGDAVGCAGVGVGSSAAFAVFWGDDWRNTPTVLSSLSEKIVRNESFMAVKLSADSSSAVLILSGSTDSDKAALNVLLIVLVSGTSISEMHSTNASIIPLIMHCNRNASLTLNDAIPRLDLYFL